jgi:broad specificity phosphatase PhoE
MTSLGQLWEIIANMQIYAYRHAQSTFNAMRKTRYKSPWLWLFKEPEILNPPLTELGRSQAALARDRDRDKLKEVDLVICSPLLRAVETMQIMTAGLEKPVVMTPLVREIQLYQSDIGEPYSTLKAKYPDYDLKHFDDDIWWNHSDKDIYRGELEPIQDCIKRLSMLSMYLDECGAAKVAMFTHANFLRSYARRLFPRHCQLIEIKH